jgi:electron transfer flavoprotein alpha/beta subunit
MDYRIKSWAFEEGRVTVWTKDDLEVDEAYIGVPGSPTVVSGLAEAPSRERKRIPITGTPDEIGRQLISLLQEEGVFAA